MKPTTAIAAAMCLGVAALVSCAKEEVAREPQGSGSAKEPARAAQGERIELPVDVMPKLVKAEIEYPEEARTRGEQGIVFVMALVGKDGRVRDASVDPQKPASPLLAGAAVEAVKKWTFEPAMAKGEPVEIWIVVPVNYKLQ